MALDYNDKVLISTELLRIISEMPVGSMSDFPLLIQALSVVFDDEIPEGAIDSSMRPGIDELREYISPEFQVVRPENRAEFLTYCRELITQRIGHLQRLSTVERQQYFEEHTRAGVAETSVANETVATPAHLITRQSTFPAPQHILNSVRHTAAPRAPRNAEAAQQGIPCLQWLWNYVRTPLAPRLMNSYGRWSGELRHDGNVYTYSSYENTFVREIDISRADDGSVSLTLTVKTEGDEVVSDNNKCLTVAYALSRTGIDNNTAHVTQYPGALNNKLELTGPADAVTEQLEAVFGAIDAIEGVGNIRPPMKDSIRQTLTALDEALAQENALRA